MQMLQRCPKVENGGTEDNIPRLVLETGAFYNLFTTVVWPPLPDSSDSRPEALADATLVCRNSVDYWSASGQFGGKCH
jgi:hypothetical protein